MGTVTILERRQLANWARRTHLFITRGPAYHYTYGRWRLRRWLNSSSNNITTISDRTFLAQLNLNRGALSQVAQAARSGNIEDARSGLRVYFGSRSNPRFYFGREDIEQISALLDSQQKKATLNIADQICQNIFYFRQAAPVKFAEGIDWSHCPNGNIDWTWDLNRHAYFQTLGRAYWYSGDERYAQKFRELLLDWLENNPAAVRQQNWSNVFEVAFRINTWVWSFYYFRDAAAFDDELCLALLKGLLMHGHYVDANLEFHTQNNHLLLEAKALAVLGLLFPEFKPAEKWWRRGVKILYQQIKAQVCPDGVHGERATLYHRIIAGELLEFVVLLENNQVPVPPEILEILGRMVEFEIWATKPNNLVPLFGDSALEDPYLRFSAASSGLLYLGRSDLQPVAPALDEGSVWLLGDRRIRAGMSPAADKLSLKSRAFPEGGYFIMRCGHAAEALYMILDAGPFGYGPAPGHGHADTLSFELYAYGQEFLVDSGFFGRTRLGDDWWNFFRSSRAHNTVVVDKQDQSILVDTWRVYQPAQARQHRWFSSEHFDFFDASHNGYKRLSQAVIHRRQVFFAKPEYWVVIDLLTGQGEHSFDLHFHLKPGLKAQLEPGIQSVNIGNESGSGLVVMPISGVDVQTDIITGATEPIQGWVSFFSGEKQPAPTLRYRQVGKVPVRFCTVLYPYTTNRVPWLKVVPLDVKVELERRMEFTPDRLTALQIETDLYSDYLVIDQGPPGVDKAFAGYKTDAQLVYIRHRKKDKKPIKVVIRQGSYLLWDGRSFLDSNGYPEDFVLDYESAGI